MKPAIAFVALTVSACGGSTAEPIAELPIDTLPIDVDPCAVARPDLGAATAEERNLFAHDVDEPLNLGPDADRPHGVQYRKLVRA
jgi:hypothetical protein